jgi:hypothetical protein
MHKKYKFVTCGNTQVWQKKRDWWGGQTHERNQTLDIAKTKTQKAGKPEYRFVTCRGVARRARSGGVTGGVRHREKTKNYRLQKPKSRK